MSTSQAVRSFNYALVDVFAERPLEGNPLAIFTDARGLTDDEMQALARETNLAETTFILPSDDSEYERTHGVRVRIFTTQEELPFAGHPTLGTASWLYWNHAQLRGSKTITLDLIGGPVTVSFQHSPDDRPGVYATMQQGDPIFGQMHDPAVIAEVTGIPIAEFDPALPIQTVSTGLPFCIVPVRSLDPVKRLAIHQAAAHSYLERTDAKFFYVFSRTAIGTDASFHARMQFYNGEDPATGSASGCAIAYMVRNSLVNSGDQTILEQGIEIFRPSRIIVSATLTRGEVRQVYVGGRTIPVASGCFSLH